MKKIFIIIFFISLQSFAANENFSVGARSAAFGHASVNISDVWSNFNNQAALGFLEKAEVGVAFENKFSVKEMATKYFAAAVPMKKTGCFGLSGSQYGYPQYNEKKVGLAFGKKLSNKVAAGVQLDYLSTYIGDDYGTRSAFAVELGLITEPLKGLRIGFHIYNLSKAKLAAYADEKIPTIARLGASYAVSKKINLMTELNKDLERKGSFRAGLEYLPVETVFIRVGVMSNPSQYSFGAGFKINNLRIDLAAFNHPVLGFSPQAALSYQFN